MNTYHTYEEETSRNQIRNSRQSFDENKTRINDINGKMM